jgi:hypothetical protein
VAFAPSTDRKTERRKWEVWQLKIKNKELKIVMVFDLAFLIFNLGGHGILVISH